jgi:hypothetical protein
MDEEISGQHVHGTRSGIKIGNRHPEILRISKNPRMYSSRMATGKSPHEKYRIAAMGC